MIAMDMESFKKNFFDKETVTKRLKDGTKKALSKIGSYVRTDARSSIKSVGKRAKAKQSIAFKAGKTDSASVVSKPGSPPLSHNGLLKKIFFAYDEKANSVVVGPIKLNAKSSGIAPGLLERGGSVDKKLKKRTVVAVYKPRPYMGPALDRTRDKIPEAFKDIL